MGVCIHTKVCEMEILIAIVKKALLERVEDSWFVHIEISAEEQVNSLLYLGVFHYPGIGVVRIFQIGDFFLGMPENE